MSRVVHSTQDPVGIRPPASVREGGNLQIGVTSGASELEFIIPGLGRFKVPVSNGIAEYRLPPTVHGGTMIFISDRVMPFPSTAIVQVVSNP
ncbi:MAG: hypothetical protein HZB39_07260 [Planctomycetes bacterium]|nr:hypothetical protein [Planctomycetota bacterium]